VACRQLGLGFEYGGVVANGTYGFAPSSQQVWLSIANCTGSETSFAQCARYSNYNYTVTNTTFYPGQLGVLSLESTLYGGKTVCQSHRADINVWCSQTWLSPSPPPSPPPLPPPAPPPVGDTCEYCTPQLPPHELQYCTYLDHGLRMPFLSCLTARHLP
jgi:hypothetical protein